MSENNATFSLDDLNELESGLGDNICRLLDDGALNYHSFLSAKKQIEEIFTGLKLNADNVFVNHGMAKGMTIQVAFERALGAFSFQARLEG